MKNTRKDFGKIQDSSLLFSIDEKNKYIPPEIEILDIKVENAFANSAEGWKDGGDWQ